MAPVPIAIAFVTSTFSELNVLNPVKAPESRSLELAPVPIAIPALPDLPFIPTVIPAWPAVPGVQRGLLIE
ncbi:hypothetical protein [Clostridium sp.]|uniref:hypothetical protein n=1 Tax=Clostridium sp. TaxID=1506 RepID=UPI0025C027FC|nr:hypothetical protein [Clostridium sp.]